MSSSNYRRNWAFIQQYRKELAAMLEDVKQIDKEVLNRAVNEGVAYAKYRTPVGLHPNPVTFTVKRGKAAGKVVSFKISNPGVGGFLRKSWSKGRSKRNENNIECTISNNAEYASFWNYGHRITNTKGGPTKGFQKGTYLLEKTCTYVDGRMRRIFEQKVREVQKAHDS